LLIASGISVGAYRAVPVRAYLGAERLSLKARGEFFEPGRERFEAGCGRCAVVSGGHGGSGRGGAVL
jgi:hypothetical protein